MDACGALTFRTQLDLTLAPAWASLAAINLDLARDPSNAPDACVLVSRDGAPLVRLNIYRPGDVVHERIRAMAFGAWVIVGFSARVVAVRLRDGQQHTTLLSAREPPNFAAFFDDFVDEDGVCIARTDERLFRFGENGRLLWTSAELGWDGVLVSDICDNAITGSGQIDAPDGWRDFTLRLDTGEMIESAVRE